MIDHRISIALTALTVAAAVASPASAAPRYYSRVEARPIYRRTAVDVPAPGPLGFKIFSTNNLGATPDPFDLALFPPDTMMIVRDVNTNQTFVNDDCFGQPQSCVFVPAAVAGPFDITVFMARPLHFGTCDVVVNDVVLDADVEFGGTLIDLGALPDRAYAFYTVHLPDGADDTQMMLFDGAWNLKAFGDRGIEDAASFVDNKTPGDRLLVGAWAASTKGYTSVVITECLADPNSSDRFDCYVAGDDADGDNLSDALEAERGTDPLHWDTDRDGLFDYFEVIGGHAGTTDVATVRMGANPRRRDLFVEYDYYASGPTVRPPWVDDMARSRESFLDLPRLPANADGSRGIALHVDTGRNCLLTGDPDDFFPGDPAGPLLCGGSCATLCGDWGGSDLLTSDQVAKEKPELLHQDHDPTTGWPRFIDQARQGLFHWAWAYPSVSGNASRGAKASFRVHGVATAGDARSYYSVMVHELGHNFTLLHDGDPQLPGEANDKASYASTMNYTYQRGLSAAGYAYPPPYPSVNTWARFSEGRLAEIDHRAFDERNYSAGAPVRLRNHLAYEPYLYRVGWDPADPDPVYPNSVDFNDDGRINSPDGLPVQFDPSPVDHPYIAEGWPDEYQARTIGDRVPTGGGAVAFEYPLVGEPIPVGNWARVWAFAPFAHADGRVYPDQTSQLENLDLPPDGVGPPAFGAGVPMNGHPDGEVAAAPFFGQGILLVFPHASGVLYYRILDPQDPAAGGWQPIPDWPPGATARQASLARVGDRVDVVFRDTSASDNDENVYLTSLRFDQVWTAAALQTSPDRTLSSYFTPSVAAGSDGNAYLAVMDAGSRAVRFFRRLTGSLGPWSEATELDVVTSESAGDGEVPLGLRRRLNLLYLPYRQQGGGAFTDGSGYLALFWNTSRPGDDDRWYHQRAYTTGYLSPAGSSAGPVKALRPRVNKGISRPFASHSIFAVRFQGDAVVTYTSEVFKEGTPLPPLYVPFASGTPPEVVAPLRDTNDAAFIDANMCLSVRSTIRRTCQCEDGPLIACSEPPAAFQEPIDCPGLSQ